MTDARLNGEVDWLRPDSKSQVTVEYEGNTPQRIDTIVVSTQHNEEVTNEEIESYIKDTIVAPLLPADLVKWRHHLPHQPDWPFRSRWTSR